jgi:hypothetical protein
MVYVTINKKGTAMEMRNGHKVVNDCEILDTKWITLNDGHCFGAVLVDNGHERKVYCGLGSGINEDVDAAHIVQHGGKMHPFSWVPFLSRAWKNRINKFCPKCGVEYIDADSRMCTNCGVEKSSDNDREGDGYAE